MQTTRLFSRTLAGLVVTSALLCACTPPGPRHPVTVTFRVNVPLSTPTTASVLITGGDATLLGSGTGPGLSLNKLADGLFSGKAVLEAGSSVHYQIVQAKPDAVELGADFSELDRSFTVAAEGEQTVVAGVARWVPPLGPNQVAVLFEVAAAPSTPEGTALYLTGNTPELGAWQPNALPLVLRADGKYVTRVAMAPGAALQFKVTKGSWYTQERGEAGEDVPNHAFTVPSAGGTAQVATLTWQDQVPGAVLTGTIEYKKDFHSTILNNDRDIIIYLPPGYSDAANAGIRYPVLYMHDGQNLMDPKTANGHTEWGVDETAQRLVRCGQMAPVIIVGVNNNADRMAEYTQVADPNHPGGNADKYGRFLIEELKPRIDMDYRTSPTTGIAGSSLGGLVSLYLGLTHSDVFTRVGAVSPSIWWGGKDILTRYQMLNAKLPLRIWEDIGTAEGTTPQEEVDNARALRDALVQKGWAVGTDLAYLEVPGAQHDEAAWARRLDRILANLFPPAQ